MMKEDIRVLMERWARWRITGGPGRQLGYGKTFMGKLIDGMPGTNCPTCLGTGRVPGAMIAGKSKWVACANCAGNGKIDLAKQSRGRTVPCPLCKKKGELNGGTCPRCRGAGEVVENFVQVNPAFIRSTYQGASDSISECLDRLVCDLRQRNAKLSNAIWMEYVDARGGTHEMKAERLSLTCGAYRTRLQRALVWIESAMTDYSA